MLAFVFSGLLALAQCAPAAPKPVPANDQTPGLLRDLDTAKAFARGVSGPSQVLANWTRAGQDLCAWDGYFCEVNPATNQNALASIDFNGVKLEGRLNLGGYLDTFLDLALFHANSNGFTGSVPDLGGLKYLYELDLSNNKLSGTFPSGVLSASGLVFLDLRFNKLTGALPTNLSTKIPTLEYLLLNNNQFSGNVPEDLCSIKTLKEVQLANNQLSPALGPKCSALKKAGVLKI